MISTSQLRFRTRLAALPVHLSQWNSKIHPHGVAQQVSLAVWQASMQYVLLRLWVEQQSYKRLKSACRCCRIVVERDPR